MATQSTRRKQLEAVALYPLDWVEERSGLVGYTKWFLFRNVPHDISWAQTLGFATLMAFISQVLTGVVLAMFYKPDPNSAYASVVNITEEVTLGWLVRGMHKWGASVFIILMFLHMARVFLFGAYKYPRELNWIVGVLILVLGMLEGFTGYLLPWDNTAYWATVVGINLNATAQQLAIEVHEVEHLGLGALPVLGAERVDREPAHAHLVRALDGVPECVLTGPVARGAREPALLCPTAVAVHHDRDVRGHARMVDVEQEAHGAVLTNIGTDFMRRSRWYSAKL